MQGRDDYLTVVNRSYGHGEGRTLKSILVLSAIHQKPVVIQHIRANRNPPGVRPEPLKELKPLAQVTGVEIEGVRNGCPTAYDAFQKRGERRLERSMEISSV